jgi:hypothetical protein
VAQVSLREPEFSALCDEFVAGLAPLPDPAFLVCVAACLTDLRDFHRDDVDGEGADLVERTIGLVTAAAAGQAPDADRQRLMRNWLEYRGDDEDSAGFADVDLPTDVHLPTYTAALELARPEDRQDVAEHIGDAAYRIALDGEDPRMLHAFIARVRAHAVPDDRDSARP